MRTLDRWADATERRLGLTSACVVGGLALLAVAALYTSPAFRLANNGLLYGYLSEAPLDFSRTNQFHYRILAPLIGWALFLRGPLFLFVPLLMAVAFLALALFASRRRGFSGSRTFVSLPLPVALVLRWVFGVDTWAYLWRG